MNRATFECISSHSLERDLPAENDQTWSRIRSYYKDKYYVSPARHLSDNIFISGDASMPSIRTSIGRFFRRSSATAQRLYAVD